jgi:hypothetical protein
MKTHIEEEMHPDEQVNITNDVEFSTPTHSWMERDRQTALTNSSTEWGRLIESKTY